MKQYISNVWGEMLQYFFSWPLQLHLAEPNPPPKGSKLVYCSEGYCQAQFDVRFAEEAFLGH